MPLASVFARTAHRAMLALQSREARKFRDGIPRAALFQEDLLRGYMRAHSRTALGRAYGFADIRGYSGFADRVPVLDYEAHRPFIERIAAGEAGQLHPHRTLFLEETSGSTGGPKLIPYGKALQGEFQRGLSTWMHALAREHPGAFRGRAYWSLSPALRAPRRSPGGIPIGVEGDSGYFDPVKALLLKATLAVPESLRKQRDADAFYLSTLISLLFTPDLSFISCWSPSFFLQLDRFLSHDRERILAGLRASNSSRGPLNARAISRLAAILSGPFTWAELWPGLACVSCWTHGSSALWLPALQERLGSVPLQAKGLLSTECFVSLPFQAGLDPVLAYRSHFFEFREEGSRGAIVPLGGLREGGTYEVIVTTGGGLCRYPTGDLVLTTSLASGLPSLRFLGRRSGWTDIAGEKVSEGSALAALEDVRRQWGTTPETASGSAALPQIAGGALVACARIEGGSRYRLHLEWNVEPASLAPVPIQAIASAMEESLSENPYYRQARALGQLGKLEVAVLARGSMERVLAAYQRRRRVGDGTVKLPFLFEDCEWNALREDHAGAV